MVQEEHRRFAELEAEEVPAKHLHKGQAIGYHGFPFEQMSGYTWCPNSLCISRDALEWFGFIIQDDGNNGTVTFHEGRNALAPVIAVVNYLANVGMNFSFPFGVELDRGLFVDFTVCTASVTVFWRPRYEREAG